MHILQCLHNFGPSNPLQGWILKTVETLVKVLRFWSIEWDLSNALFSRSHCSKELHSEWVCVVMRMFVFVSFEINITNITSDGYTYVTNASGWREGTFAASRKSFSML